MTAIHSIVSRALILAAIGLASQAAWAEYYLYDPEPVVSDFVEYKTPHHYNKIKKSHKHKKIAKRRSHYSISVTYYWPVCPGCACTASSPGCYPNDEQLNTKAVTGHFVHFSGQPCNYRETRKRGQRDETFDLRTADDDVMHDPNMNNQY